MNLTEDVKMRISKIKMLVMDVDGTLTDGKIYVNKFGEEFKAFHVRDGLGIKMLIHNGIIPVILSGRFSEAVVCRAVELGIEEVLQGVEDKLREYQELKSKYSCSDEEIAYVGDDINDLPVIRHVGVSFAVRNCANQIKQSCHFITQCDGGSGAVREIADILLENRLTKEVSL